MASPAPSMSDFDPDAFLNSIYPNLGVGGMTMTDSMDDLFAPSTSGVGVAASPSPPPPPPPPLRTVPTTRLAAVGVGSVSTRTVSSTGGKQPRRPTAGKRLPGLTNPHRRRRRRPRRPRSLLSSPTTTGGTGGSSDGDDDSSHGDSDASTSSSSSHPGGRHRMSQEELRRQLELLSNDQVQTASGRRIAGITTTNTITITYKDGGRPRVARHSSRVSH